MNLDFSVPSRVTLRTRYSFGEGLSVLSSSDGTRFKSGDPYPTLSGAASSPTPAYGYADYIEEPIVYMELNY